MFQLYKNAVILILFLVVVPTKVFASKESKRADISEAGFYQVEPFNFSMQQPGKNTISQTTSEARIWYSYHPSRADLSSSRDPYGKPLFVMMNGGPGSATSTNLFSMNTAPYTLDKAVTGDRPASFAVNPHSWAVMGNLLYIDAPNTGFSYNVLSSNTLDARARDFATSYNPYVDAAQVLRVVLRFLKEHPDISANQVILVGESYGATRASIMLNMLLHYSGYRDGSRIYSDPSMVAEIEEHLAGVFPGSPGVFEAETIAGQFGRQVFIQPQLTGIHQDDVIGEMFEQKGSIVDAIASGAKGRLRYNRCKNSLCNKTMWANYYIHYIAGKDQYNYTKPNTWTDELEAHAISGLLDVNVLSSVLDYDITRIPLLRADARNGKGAYRDLGASSRDDDDFDDEYLKHFLGGNVGPGSRENIKLLLVESSRKWLESKYKHNTGSTLEEVLGKLDRIDNYLIGTNTLLYIGYKYNTFTAAGYDINQDSSAIYGELFLQNLPFVNTFITDAAYDLVLYSPALPVSFNRYNKIVDSVDISHGSKSSVGYFTINFKPGALGAIGTPLSRTVYMPYYGESGHSVSSTEPGKLLADIRAWLMM